MQENKQITFKSKKEIIEDPNLPFTKGMISHYILNAETNGLKPCLRRVGKRVLFRYDLFLDWIDSQAFDKWNRKGSKKYD